MPLVALLLYISKQSVFHVSQLKPKLGSNLSVLSILPPVNLVGIIQPESMEILTHRSRPKNNCSITELLVQWLVNPKMMQLGRSIYHSLTQAYPHLVGKVL
jgi:hypothetical protein